MSSESPVNGPLVSTYKHARGMVIFLAITDAILLLIALSLLAAAVQDSNSVLIVAVGIYMVVAAINFPKRLRMLQLSFGRGVIFVHDDGLIVHGQEQFALPWHIIERVTVFKVSGFGRLKLALNTTDDQLDINMVANIADLEADILSRWTPPSQR